MTAWLRQTLLEGLDDDAFEDWLCVYFREVFGLDLPPQRNGVSGDRQHGVDLYFRNSVGELVGVQAKAYRHTLLTPTKFDKEVRDAHNFQPALSHYIVCTSARRSARLLAHARQATLHDRPNVRVLSLEDLAEDASRYPLALRNLMSRMDVADQHAMRSFLEPLPAVAMAVAAAEPSGITDVALRVIEDWIDVGNPARALRELEHYQGMAPASDCLRVRVRAQFAQGEFAPVLIAARQQLAEVRPLPILLAYGAHAAQIQNDAATADAWLNQAWQLATGVTRAQIVGSYVRVHALRGNTTVDLLETYVRDTLGTPEPVALALADAAFQLGGLERAAHWYRIARDRQPQWPCGAAGNALGAEIWQLIDAGERGKPNTSRLRGCAEELAALVANPSIQLPALQTPMWVNLGHAYQALGEPFEAARAWDRALVSPDCGEDLWVRRCILSANDGVPLPADDLAARWTTPRARIALACACTIHESWDRTQGLLDSVAGDSAASRGDQILAQIERIRLDVRGEDARVTPAHVATMLAFVAPHESEVPLFAWLVDHLAAAGADFTEQVRAGVRAMADDLPVDPLRRLALAESLLGAGLDDIAHRWLASIEEIALSPGREVVHVRAASVLLRLYTSLYRFDEARSLISQLRQHMPQSVVVALSCGRAMEEAGDRQEAYTLLTEAIRGGQQHGSLILSWARIAVLVRRQREAHRLLRSLTLSPSEPPRVSWRLFGLSQASAVAA